MTNPLEAVTATGWKTEPVWAGIERVPDALAYRVANFIYREALLLDERQLSEWLALWSDSGRYWVPLVWDSKTPDENLNIMYADYLMLKDRVDRLEAGKVPSQDPPSRVARTLANVLCAVSEGDHIFVRSTLTLVELRGGRQTVHGGYCTYLLQQEGADLRVVQKKVGLLNCEEYLGNLTFIL